MANDDDDDDDIVDSLALLSKVDFKDLGPKSNSILVFENQEDSEVFNIAKWKEHKR